MNAGAWPEKLERISDELDRDLNVLPFEHREPSGPMPANPEAEIERVADIHRRGAARFRQRMADTRRKVKTEVAALDAEKRAAKQRYDAEVARINERLAAVKEKGERDIEADRRLVAGSDALLKAIAE